MIYSSAQDTVPVLQLNSHICNSDFLWIMYSCGNKNLHWCKFVQLHMCLTVWIFLPPLLSHPSNHSIVLTSQSTYCHHLCFPGNRVAGQQECLTLPPCVNTSDWPYFAFSYPSVWMPAQQEYTLFLLELYHVSSPTLRAWIISDSRKKLKQVLPIRYKKYGIYESSAMSVEKQGLR